MDLAALASLAALVLAFFWPAASGRAWIPHGGGDLVSFLWPTYTFAAQTYRSGHVPLWNPHLYSGAPFAADNQSGAFYPINLLVFLLLPALPYRAMQWLAFFHFWLAGAGMYLALRMEKAARPAALAAAIAFMFSDVFVTHVGNLNIVAVSAYLPWVFALLRRGLRRRSAGWCAGSGALLGIAALAGHAQMTLIVAAAAGLYGLWEIVRARQRRLLGLVAVWAATALGLSGIAVIPAIELTRYTARAQLDYAEATRWSLPPLGLVGFFSPSIFGRGPAGFWGPWERVETGYIGAATLLLAGMAVISSTAKTQRREENDVHAFASSRFGGSDRRALGGFLALLSALGLLTALGNHTPFYRLLFEFIPGFGQLRVPARYVLLPDFALAFLAGLGLQGWLDGQIGRRRVIGLTAALMTAGAVAMPAAYFAVTREMPWADTPEHRSGMISNLGLYLALIGAAAALLVARSAPPARTAEPGRADAVRQRGVGERAASARSTAIALALAALMAGDLTLAGANIEIQSDDPTVGFQHTQAIEYLRAQPGPTRMDSAASVWQPDAAAMFGLEDIGGIHNPLALADYQAYYWSVGYRGSPQYNFLGAQFVVAEKGIPPGDETFVPVYADDPAVDIYLNTGALPRANLIYSARIASDHPTAFDLIHAADFDPAREAVIEGGPALRGESSPSASLQANLFYLGYSADRFAVVARTPSPAYLVFSEVWYPGWRATVDGDPVPIYRANYAFRAIYLPPGEHRVEMRFEPITWKVGLAVTSLTILSLLAWGVLALWRRTVFRAR